MTDSERLDWAMRRISDKAWRDAGLVYGDTSQIPDMIDAAIAGERSRLAWEADRITAEPMTEDERIAIASDHELDRIGTEFWHMERDPGESSDSYRKRILARKAEFKEWRLAKCESKKGD